jgi:hypothetical protein
VKIIYHDQAGREVILEIISQGGFWWGGVVLNQPATAKALEDASMPVFLASCMPGFWLITPVTLKLCACWERAIFDDRHAILAGERRASHGHILLKLATRVGRPTLAER